MRPFPKSTEIGLNVLDTVMYSLAIISTAIRLYRRRKVGRLWWDDAFAFLAVLGAICLFILYWLRAVPKDSVVATRQALTLRFWVGMLMSWFTLWMTRISLALGTARIFPPQHPAHRVGLWTSGVFGCFLVALLINASVQCAPASAWAPPPGAPPTAAVMCFMRESTIYFSATVGFCADIYLIAVPVIALWNLKAPSTFRLMLFTTFMGSVVITIITTIIVIFQHLPPSLEPWRSETQVRINYLESAVSVVVCNLIVLVPYGYRLLYGQSITGGQGRGRGRSTKPRTTTDDNDEGTHGGETGTTANIAVVGTHSGLESGGGTSRRGSLTRRMESTSGISLGTLSTKRSDASLTDISESRGMIMSDASQMTGIWSAYDPESMEIGSYNQSRYNHHYGQQSRH